MKKAKDSMSDTQEKYFLDSIRSLLLIGDYRLAGKAFRQITEVLFRHFQGNAFSPEINVFISENAYKNQEEKTESDHKFPLKEIYQDLLQKQNFDNIQLKEYLKNKIVYVHLTVEEHKKLSFNDRKSNRGFDFEYETHGIKILSAKRIGRGRKFIIQNELL